MLFQGKVCDVSSPNCLKEGHHSRMNSWLLLSNQSWDG